MNLLHLKSYLGIEKLESQHPRGYLGLRQAPWICNTRKREVFLMTLLFCAIFSDVHAPPQNNHSSWDISLKYPLAINRHILVSHFGHLVRLILGRFSDDVLPYSRAPIGSGAFFDVWPYRRGVRVILVDTPQGLRLFQLLLCLLAY